MSFLFHAAPLTLLFTFALIPLTALTALSGELGPADLSPQEMTQAFPRAGTKWKAFCGAYDNGRECLIELGLNELIIDETHRISYLQIGHAESRDAHAAMPELAKVDPAYAGWPRYRGVNNVKYFKNTVLLAYKDPAGALSVALFAFSEDKISDWYGFSNAMRMIVLGARPLPPDPN